MNYRLRKSNFSIVWISGSISIIIWEDHGIHGMPYSSRIISEMTPQNCTIANMELNTGVLSTLAECYLGELTLTSIWRHNCYLNIFRTPFVSEHGRQCMPCSTKFSITLQTDFFQQKLQIFSKKSTSPEKKSTSPVIYSEVYIKWFYTFRYITVFGYSSMFFKTSFFTKGDSFCDFLFASLDKVARPTWVTVPCP